MSVSCGPNCYKLISPRLVDFVEEHLETIHLTESKTEIGSSIVKKVFIIKNVVSFRLVEHKHSSCIVSWLPVFSSSSFR